MDSHSHVRWIAGVFSRAAILVALGAGVACGNNAQTVAPSALSSDPSTYDGQDVAVTGTAKGIGTRQTRRGTATTYQLCDTACINVVQFDAGDVAEGSKVTATGRFHASFGRQKTIQNVLVIGGRAAP